MAWSWKSVGNLPVVGNVMKAALEAFSHISTGHDHDGANSKALSGITSSQMASAVQTSLGKADSAVQSTASGKKVAGDVGTVTGTLEITSGLATVTSVAVTLAADAAATGTVATVSIPAQTGGNAGKFTIKVWQPTAADNTAPTASSTATAVSWVAFGT